MRWRVSPRIVLSFSVAMCLASYFYWRSLEPWRVCKRFMRAVDQRDVDTILSLTHPQETEPPLGLNRRKISQTLDLFHRLTTDMRIVSVRKFPYNSLPPDGRSLQWFFDYADSSKGDRLSPGVVLVPLQEGWKVRFSFWAFGVCTTYQPGQGDATALRKHLYRESGLAGYVSLQGTFRSFPTRRSSSRGQSVGG